MKLSKSQHKGETNTSQKLDMIGLTSYKTGKENDENSHGSWPPNGRSLIEDEDLL